MGMLASTYRNQGRWKETEEVGLQMMETRKRTSLRVLREEHSDTLISITNLAFAFKFEGRNDKAISLIEKYFQLQKQVLDPNIRIQRHHLTL
ncbi:hypothetical protein K469DRAFT_803063 [Zopfia rhizophila CBS 207.26]|uniref:TPR-like protein n=1 Tax=Zopfia rhizophila CBS 207.26 TaxID=1314779 RepID=A0A6A6DM11_9PEZI|nr:hypothetical protein K469DRAFT_803063 [Zopfia rhizophila CBS 207.26]